MEIYYSNMNSVKFTPEEIPKINILESFASIKVIKKYDWMRKYFLDSGAFSVFNSGKEIDIKKYINFIHENSKEIDFYVSLDVIGNGKKSFENYLIMKKEGLNPIPCFHYGESIEYLYKYTNETNYIGLGGITKKGIKKTREIFLNDIFSLFRNSNEIGFHGFGINEEKLILKYPWRSVDSSSIHMQARYGGIYTPWGFVKINPNVNSNDLKWRRNKINLIMMKQYLEKIEFDYDKAILQNQIGIKERCKISIFYFEQLKKKVSSIYFEENDKARFF